MQITQKKLSDTNIQLTVTADQAQLDAAKAAALKAVAKDLKVPGFRAGKVPAALVEKHANPAAVQSDFLDRIMNVLYVSALADQKIRPVAQPEVKLKKFVPFTELEAEFVIDVIGNIKVSDYKKLRVPRKQATVSDKEVDEVIDRIRAQGAEKTEVDRAVKDGDEATIDFSGADTKTKEAIAGTDGKAYPLTIGSNAFIPGFEPELIGLKAGDTKTFTVTFPKDYGTKELQNRKVDFTVTVKKVQSVDLPKVDDAFAAKIGQGQFKTVAEMRTLIKTELQQEKDNRIAREYADEVLLKITNASKVSIPPSLIDEEVDRMVKEQRQQMVYGGKTWEEFLKDSGQSEEDYRKSIRSDAETRVKAGFIISEISEREGITVSPQEIDTKISQLKAQYTDKKMHEELDKPENRSNIEARMISERTADLVVGYACKK